MLRNRDIRTVRPMVEGRMYSDAPITAIPGTPLSQLNNTARLLFVPESEAAVAGLEEDALSPNEERLKTASMALDGMGRETHSIVMGETAKFVSDRLSATMNYARNTINPLVSEILTKAQEESRAAVSGSINDPVIEMSELPEVYQTGTLESLLAAHRTKGPEDAPLPFSLSDQLTQDMTDEAMLATLKTGIPDFDALVAELYERWENKADLISGSELSEVVTYNRATGKNPFTDHCALFAFLFLMGVRAGRSPANELDAMSGEERVQISKAINYFGNVLNVQLNAVMRMIENRVLMVQDDHNVVRVNAVVYRPWVEAHGGSPEAVIGWVQKEPANARMSVSVDNELYDNPAKYEAYYERTRRTDLATGRIQSLTAINRVVRQGVSMYLREEHGDDAHARQEAIGRAMDYLDQNPYSHNVALDGYILRVVCYALGREQSDAYLFLTTMRDLMADDDQLTAQAAALCAASRVVCRWVASQMARQTFK